MAIYPYVRLIVPFGIHISDNVYDVKLNGTTFAVRTKVLPSIDGSWVTTSGLLTTPHDTFGRFTRSQLTVAFVKQPIETDCDDPDDECLKLLRREHVESAHLIEQAIMVANRLLQVCRDQLRESQGDTAFHLGPITKYDIGDFETGLSNRFITECFPITMGIVSLGPIAALALGENPVQCAEEPIIRDMLDRETSIPSWRVLLRSSENRLWRGEYYMVPVEANAAFESVVEYTLRLATDSLGKEHNGSLSFFDRLIRLQQWTNELRVAKALDELDWAPPVGTGWKRFAADARDSAVKRWYERCYLLRCDVVHSGFLDVSRCQAAAALSSASAAMSFIQQLMP